MGLNYFALASVIGSPIHLVPSPQFGRFGTLATYGEMLKRTSSVAASVKFSHDAEKVIVEAFESVRAGAAPDRILWDADLANRFYAKARQMGIHAPARDIGRRLINIRKSPKFYEKLGIRLSDTTVDDPQASIVWEHAHAIEYALMSLKYRFQLSIDDILIDPAFAGEYDKLVRGVSPGLSSGEARLAALYIRKSRHLKKEDRTLFEELDLTALRRRMDDLGAVDEADRWSLPESEGLFQLIERRRTLFVGRAQNLRAALTRVAAPETIRGMSSALWEPRAEQIRARVFVGDKLLGVGSGKWQLGLIRDEVPLLNWPVSR